VGQLGEQRLFVCKETQRWRGRPLQRKSGSRGDLWGFVALRLCASRGQTSARSTAWLDFDPAIMVYYVARYGQPTYRARFNNR
jgi:hypothetical protein